MPRSSWLALVLAALLACFGHAADITFIAVSDTHFMVPDAKNDGKRKILVSMNDIAGRKFPASLNGANIGKPLGVMVAGDLIDGGREAQSQWKLWTRDFGLTGGDGAVLRLPVYETWGNHDGGKLVPDAIAMRNKSRTGITGISTDDNGDGTSYSWDWGQLHLVSVGMYPGNTIESKKHRSPGYAPRRSLDFLVGDLSRQVGGSRRPVVVMQHLNLPNDSDEWWTSGQRNAYYDVLKKYNVVAIVDGHEGGGLWKWKGIDVLGCNDINSGYWVVQVAGDRMMAARTTSGDSWKKAVLDKAIEMGKPIDKFAPAAKKTRP
jgi:cytolysin (calcineurin-like family phosphatase)